MAMLLPSEDTDHCMEEEELNNDEDLILLFGSGKTKRLKTVLLTSPP